MKKAFLLILVLVVAAVLWRNEQKRKPPAFQVGHRVTVTWDASPSQGVTSYRIYASSVSGGPYTLVGFVDARGPRIFVDTAVESRRTYYFVVTAVDFHGTESPYSIQRRAEIP